MHGSICPGSTVFKRLLLGQKVLVIAYG
ncbi:hypothetical protein [Acetobacter syzygii]